MPRGPHGGEVLKACDVNADRFWSHVRIGRSDECWVWVGSLNNKGYGQMGLPNYGRTVVAHRVAYALANGQAPAGLCVMHACDNPPCVNPAHLSLGTQAENLRDMRRKRRDFRPAPKALTQCEHGIAQIACMECSNVREGRRGEAFDAFFARYCAPLLPESMEALATITDERRSLVFAREFGCFGFAPTTASAIAVELGITRERVRQLRNDVLLRIGVTRDEIRLIPTGVSFKQAA